MRMEKDNGVLEDKALKAIEQLWGFQLPLEYRKFLLEKNGGIPKLTRFWFKNKEDGSCVSSFFGIVKDFNDNLLLKQKYSGDRVPNNTLPIARDVYGNFILLSVKGEDRGKIYFWDHEQEADTDRGEAPNYSNLTLIADSFEEFVEGLSEE